jgi:peptide/nickel transport system permease protein
MREGPSTCCWSVSWTCSSPSPQLILALAAASILGPAVQNVVIAAAIPIVPRAPRVVRAITRSVKENVYVEAVSARGATRQRIVLQHILPNVVAPYIIIVTAQLAGAILAEAALSYLGLGAAEPTPSWGLMLSGSASAYAEKAPWIALFPGIAISLAVFGFNLSGDSLRGALDPKLRGKGSSTALRGMREYHRVSRKDCEYHGGRTGSAVSLPFPGMVCS